VLALVGAVLAIGIGATLPFVLSDSPKPDLSAVRTYDQLPTTHVDEEVEYAQAPPVGGKHFGIWLECGVYDSPVPDEMAVHDLEHGAFWIAYDADALDEDDIEALADQLPDNGIMSPYDDLDSPVVVTVWGNQLALAGADDPRLALFVHEYAGGTTAPEPMSSCAGGITPDQLDELDGVVAS